VNPYPTRNAPIVIGLDVGSTTVKATVVDPETKAILWRDYHRHHTRQPECVLEFLERIVASFPGVVQEDIRIFMTGSGSAPIVPSVGARFVQEVNAVTMAVEDLHPDVGSVIELGGQDAKIIMFRKNEETGEKQVMTSMNDKCASGTGATIDKCMIKVGMPEGDMAGLKFDAERLHHVAAKCGVFAETDIVNLVKSGIPAPEIMNSLADAIVTQNLSVLTRGNTLKDRVLLLGGPNTFLPFLQECWRLRIPESWEQRGHTWDKSRPVEELIFVPDGSQYYAAYGAVLYGLHEPQNVGCFTGLQGLRDFIHHGRKARLGEAAGPALVKDKNELDEFRETYRIPRFQSATFARGEVVRGVIGLDGGSTSSKCVVVDEEGKILLKEYTLSKGNPIQDMKDMLRSLRARVEADGATLDVIGFGATGYAADVLEESLRADVNIVETVAHMMSAVHFFGPDVDVICDIGGQDIKVLFMQNGDIKNFRLSNQCSAGNGMLLQAMADQFGIPVQEYAGAAFEAGLSPKFSYGCAVFLDADRVNFQKEGYTKEELLAGLAMVLPKNVWQYVVQIPRMASLGTKFVLQGGTQHNLAALKAQVDYIKERVPNADVFVHPHTGEAGAIGAAMETLRVVKRRGTSTFIGLDSAIDIDFTSKNDEETRCHFCANECSRTFIDTRTPDGRTSRYISGFSCEKGTVESLDALKVLQKERNKIRKRYPNLVEYEAKLAFRQIRVPVSLPAAGSATEDVVVETNFINLIEAKGILGRFFGKREQKVVRRGFVRSSVEAQKKREQIRIGIPKALNVWSMAPFFRSYLETLGVDGRNVVFSEDTSEEMWAEGARYGSVDPCFPAKVTQAHIHQLLFKERTDESPLHYVFFPCITHLPTFLDGTMDSAACPIVAGTPEVMKAAFTKEVDFFATRGIEYLAPALTFNEHNLLKRQMFEVFGPRLGVTRDENDFAVDEGWKTLDEFDRIMQEKGRHVLEEIERDDQIGLLMLGRPYHSDPGLNHTVMDEFQVLGYPILSMRSLPRDRAWLQRFFEGDLRDGKIRDVLGVDDVWPEAYSSNSAQKVWSARFASRHPNIAVLDLSSFKCGHDAPTYGIIDNIISTAGTPYSALHDIDANKPTGSIRIRVKTYAHSLKLHKERLDDVAAQKEALSYRVDEKRVQLLRLKQEQIHARSGRLDAELERNIEDALSRMRAYEAKFEKRAELPSGMISVQSLSLSKKRFQREGASA